MKLPPDHDKIPVMEREEECLMFLVEIDGMIESTEEFIADDELTPENDPEGRLTDLKALNHVRQLFVDFYGIEDQN
jgi:hypothetical protein